MDDCHMNNQAHIVVDLFEDEQMVGPQFLIPNPLKSLVWEAESKIIT